MHFETISLNELEKHAASKGLLLRIQERRPLKLWSLKLVVAQSVSDKRVKILGEMKAWAYAKKNGLQLDTMRVAPKTPTGIGDLIWAATMAWAIEKTPCRMARLLAISDEDTHHKKLLRYFKQRGFQVTKEIGSNPSDLPFRMIWGGAGTLMAGECKRIHHINCRRWLKNQ